MPGPTADDVEAGMFAQAGTHFDTKPHTIGWSVLCGSQLGGCTVAQANTTCPRCLFLLTRAKL